MLDGKKVKLGIAPIAWTNDDLPELGEMCIRDRYRSARYERLKVKYSNWGEYSSVLLDAWSINSRIIIYIWFLLVPDKIA